MRHPWLVPVALDTLVLAVALWLIVVHLAPLFWVALGELARGGGGSW